MMSAKIVGKMRPCKRCGGKGWIHDHVNIWTGRHTETIRCPECKGQRVVAIVDTEAEENG